MNKLNTFKTKHAVLFSMAVIVCHYLLNMASKAILMLCGLQNDGTIRWYLPKQFLVLLVSLLLIFVCGQKHVLAPRKGFFRSLWSGAVFFVLAAICFPVVIMAGLEEGREFASVCQIAAFIIFVAFIGLAEEFLFRGIITDCMLAQFGKTPLGVVGAVAISSILFGCSHITNIFAGQPIDETLVQVIVVSLTSVLLSAIYAKHRNVYGVAVLHALLDMVAMCDIGVFGGSLLTSNWEGIGFWEMLGQSLMSQSIFIIIALFVFHPGVIKKIAARNSEENDNTQKM